METVLSLTRSLVGSAISKLGRLRCHELADERADSDSDLRLRDLAKGKETKLKKKIKDPVMTNIPTECNQHLCSYLGPANSENNHAENWRTTN
ncbi:hypothetical protein E2562_034509 [Oryza meyeriana var. granulata]|uniref:Uncharacterized protein n=1 Tax=Oryza meyeriana var. granulata TaxID=110450 RepID=A0A6G1CWY1_9ORYZ|nr:hypothetical protein E2562_034509 [Oryza meyeriana var. granulata]